MQVFARIVNSHHETETMARQATTTPRKQPRQRRSQAMVETLVTATARVLVRDGYDRASTNRIATEAGVSVGSLYQYFPSKEALVAAVVEREIDGHFRVVADKLAEVMDAPLPVAVRGLIEAIFASHRLRPRLHRVLNDEVPRVGALRRVAEVLGRTEDLLRVALEARRAELRPRDPALTAFLLVHAVEGVMEGLVHGAPRHVEDRRLVDELADLVLRYVR